ncbi:MAG: FecCD family ABC transporter permease [Sarcina sp.]
MIRYFRKHYYQLIIIAIIILIFSMILGIAVGSSHIDLDIVFKYLTNKITGFEIFKDSSWTIFENIIWEIRVPRVILAALTGGGLALCGILMQCVTRNSIADPYILGISSGASAGAVFIIVVGGAFLTVTVGAFIGAIICGILVFIVGTNFGRDSSTTRLVLSGLALSTIFAAVTNLIIYSAENSNQARAAIFWIMGSLGGARWSKLLLPAIVLILVVGISIFISKSLDILLLGDTSATILGMNVKLIKTVIILASTFLTAVLVSITGAIGFVGLVIPHICRTFTGSNHKKLIPLSVIIGAVFLVISDIFARVVFAPRELPIGIITAIIGGPFFLWLIAKNNYSFGGND